MEIELNSRLEYWVDPFTWEFVGDFEGMGRDFDDPRHCQRPNTSIKRRVVLSLLAPRQDNRLVDIGCGLARGFASLRIDCYRVREIENAFGTKVGSAQVQAVSSSEMMPALWRPSVTR